MTPSERGYKTQYEHLWQRYRNEVIDRNEEQARWMYQLRDQMVTIAQLQRELEASNELVKTLLFGVTVDNSKETVSK